MTKPEAQDEVARVRAAYARRTERGLDSRYQYWRPENLYIHQSRERTVLGLLKAAGLLPLSGREILDVGCGDGSQLESLKRYGAEEDRLHGIDLLETRVDAAKRRLTQADVRNADARSLPFAEGSFDLVLAFTLFSSVLDDRLRAQIAAEMLRVSRQDGLILVYDFWINPLNRDARSLSRASLRRLFQGHKVLFRATTLAPPLLRALVRLPGGWLACNLLEVIPFVKTHYVAAVRV